MGNIYNFGSGDSGSIKVVDFSISFGNLNLTPVPPKYIEGVEVERYENESSGKFTINLSMPVNAFETPGEGSNDFTVVLSAMIASTQTASSDKPKMSFYYGWQNGTHMLVKDATISNFDFNISASGGSGNNLISFKISGVAEKIVDTMFEKHFYSILEAKEILKQINIVTTESSVYETISDISKNEYINLVRELNSENFNPVDLFKPNLWEFGITGAPISIEELNNTSDSRLNLNGSSLPYPIYENLTTEQKSYFTDLYNRRHSTPIKRTVTTDTKAILSSNFGEDIQISQIVEKLAYYIYGDSFAHIYVDHNDYIYNVNRDFEEISNIIVAIKNLDKSSTTLKELLDKLVGYCVVPNTYNYNNRQYVIARSDLGFIDFSSQAFSVLADTGDTLLLMNENGVVFPVVLYSGQFINSGVDSRVFEIKYDVMKNGGTIWIGANAGLCDRYTYIISNNNSNSDVLSFNVASSGLPGIAAIRDVLNTTTVGVEAASGLCFVTKTDTGGMVPLDRTQAKNLTNKFVSSITKTVGEDISQASLSVWGSHRSSSYTVGETLIRVMPFINGSKSIWCGDYKVFGIKDSIDSNGFITTLSLRFEKSLFFKELDEALDKSNSVNIDPPPIKPQTHSNTSNNTSTNSVIPVDSNVLNNSVKINVGGSGVAYDANATANFFNQLGQYLFK